MAWSLYILRCGDGTLYTGVATDVARRLGGASSARAEGGEICAWPCTVEISAYARGRNTLGGVERGVAN